MRPAEKIEHNVSPGMGIVPVNVYGYEWHERQKKKQKTNSFFFRFLSQNKISKIGDAQQNGKIFRKEGKPEECTGKKVEQIFILP